jgi:hypothetical protein
MNFKVDGEDVLTLTTTQKKLLKHFIRDDEFDADMKRRVAYIITHKYEQCFKQFKNKWDPRLLANGVTSIPLDPDAYAELVFAQPDYKSRTEEDATQPPE